MQDFCHKTQVTFKLKQDILERIKTTQLNKSEKHANMTADMSGFTDIFSSIEVVKRPKLLSEVLPKGLSQEEFDHLIRCCHVTPNLQLQSLYDTVYSQIRISQLEKPVNSECSSLVKSVMLVSRAKVKCGLAVQKQFYVEYLSMLTAMIEHVDRLAQETCKHISVHGLEDLTLMSELVATLTAKRMIIDTNFKQKFLTRSRLFWEEWKFCEIASETPSVQYLQAIFMFFFWFKYDTLLEFITFTTNTRNSLHNLNVSPKVLLCEWAYSFQMSVDKFRRSQIDKKQQHLFFEIKLNDFICKSSGDISSKLTNKCKELKDELNLSKITAEPANISRVIDMVVKETDSPVPKKGQDSEATCSQKDKPEVLIIDVSDEEIELLDDVSVSMKQRAEDAEEKKSSMPSSTYRPIQSNAERSSLPTASLSMSTSISRHSLPSTNGVASSELSSPSSSPSFKVSPKYKKKQEALNEIRAMIKEIEKRTEVKQKYISDGKNILSKLAQYSSQSSTKRVRRSQRTKFDWSFLYNEQL